MRLPFARLVPVVDLGLQRVAGLKQGAVARAKVMGQR